jgi:hypothetical protein
MPAVYDNVPSITVKWLSGFSIISSFNSGSFLIMVLRLGCLHHVDMGCVADVSVDRAASIFRVEVCSMKM